MPLEFKSIKSDVQGVLRLHKQVSENLKKAQEHGVVAASHSADYAAMMKGIGGDLEFAATQLGNGGSGSEVKSEQKPAGNNPITPPPVNNSQF